LGGDALLDGASLKDFPEIDRVEARNHGSRQEEAPARPEYDNVLLGREPHRDPDLATVPGLYPDRVIWLVISIKVASQIERVHFSVYSERLRERPCLDDWQYFIRDILCFDILSGTLLRKYEQRQ
jgi:hypothetical protein